MWNASRDCLSIDLDETGFSVLEEIVSHRGRHADRNGLSHDGEHRIELLGLDEIDRFLECLLECLLLAEVKGLVLHVGQIGQVRICLDAVQEVDDLIA